MFTEVGSAAAGFTLVLLPPRLSAPSRAIVALAGSATLAAIAWPIAGEHPAAAVAVGAVVGLATRLGIGVFLVRSIPRR